MELDETVTFLGDCVTVLRDVIARTLKMTFSIAPAHVNKQRAGAVGALGMKYFKAGKMQSAAEHVPEYLRMSQAERERAEREGQG